MKSRQQRNQKKIPVYHRKKERITLKNCSLLKPKKTIKKVGLRIKELERIYGIREGRPEKLPNNSVVKTQSDLASMMGVSLDTLNNYKKLAEMIPGLESLVDTGTVTPTTALSIMKNLSEQEQEELIASFDVVF